MRWCAFHYARAHTASVGSDGDGDFYLLVVRNCINALLALHTLLAGTAVGRCRTATTTTTTTATHNIARYQHKTTTFSRQLGSGAARCDARVSLASSDGHAHTLLRAISVSIISSDRNYAIPSSSSNSPAISQKHNHTFHTATSSQTGPNHHPILSACVNVRV